MIAQGSLKIISPTLGTAYAISFYTLALARTLLGLILGPASGQWTAVWGWEGWEALSATWWDVIYLFLWVAEQWDEAKAG